MELIGRQSELKQLQRSVDRSGRHALLSGTAGIGKTALASAFAQTVKRRRRVILVAGLPGAPPPLTPFAHLCADSDVASQSPIELLVRVRGELTRSAEADDAILVVDDAHWLDDMSCALVRQLVTDAVTPVILLMRSSEPTPPGLEWVHTDLRFDRIELQPLAPARTTEMATLLLGASVSERLATSIWDASGGVPLFVAEVARTARLSGSITRTARGGFDLDLGHALEVPSGILRIIGDHVEHLPADARRLLITLCVGGQLRLSLLDRLDDAGALDLLRHEGLAVVVRDEAGPRARFGHDLHRMAALASTGRTERRAATWALVQAIEGGAHDASERLLCAQLRLELDEPDAQVFEDGAGIAFSRFDMELAVRLADAAISERSSFRAFLTRAVALGALGDADDADRSFERATTAAGGDGDLVEAGIAQAADALMYRADPAAARSALADVIDLVDSEEAAASIQAFLATTNFYSGELDAAIEAGSPLLDGPVFPVEAAIPLGSCWAVLGQPDGVLATFERALREMPSGSEPPYFVFHNLPWARMLALWQLGRLGEDPDPLGPFRRAGVGRASLSSDLATIAMPATYALLVGHLDDSADGYRRLGAALEAQPMHVGAFNQLLIVMLHSQRGDLAGAEAAMRAAMRYPPLARAGFGWWEERAGVLLDVASGRVEQAVGQSLEMCERYADQLFHVTTSLHDIVRFGRPGPVCDDLAAMARRPGATWWDRTCAAHATALAEADPEGLLEVGLEFERGGLDLHALEALCQASDVGAGAPCHVAAMTAIGPLAQRCAGARTPATLLRPKTLSHREHQVALLAAQGKTNKQIAELLGTSVRTVGNQLGRTYAKLGVTGRDELRSALDLSEGLSAPGSE